MVALDVVVGNDLSKGKEVDTSKAAWAKARHGAARMRERIYRTMQHNENNCGWDEGITLRELCEALNKEPHALSGRLTELHETGRIKKTAHIRNGCRAWTSL